MEEKGNAVIGYVNQEPVHSDEGLITLGVGNGLKTRCVYYPGKKVIRRMTVKECLAAWDYSDDLVREGQINKSSKKGME